MRRRFTHLFVAALIAFFTLGGPVSASLAFAQDATTAASPEAGSAAPLFSVSPVSSYPDGFVEYELNPGDSTSFEARISVGGSVDASLSAFAGDSINPVNGGFAVADASDPKTGAATWFTLSKSAFEIKAGAQETFTVSVSVPKDAKPGQYVVGLVVQTDKPIGGSGQSGSFGLLQVLRSAAAVQITVPGAVKASYTLGAPTMVIQNGVPSVNAPIVNTGNVLVKPAGVLTVSSTGGKQIVKAPITVGSIYMGNSSGLQVVLPGQFAPGNYLVSISLKDDASGKTASVSKAHVTLAPATAAPKTFSFGVSVKAEGNPVRYADVSAVVENNGPAIATAKVVLHVYRDGTEVETYSLADKQAIGAGQTTITQRYIPKNDWSTGTYTFAVEIIAVDGANGTETSIGVVPSTDKIVVK